MHQKGCRAGKTLTETKMSSSVKWLEQQSSIEMYFVVFSHASNTKERTYSCKRIFVNES